MLRFLYLYRNKPPPLGKTFPRGGFLLISYVPTVILYLVLIAVIRLLGKRQIGQLEPSELVVAMLIADLASIPMQDSAIPLLSGLVPILTVLGLELVLSMLSMRSIFLRRSGFSYSVIMPISTSSPVRPPAAWRILRIRRVH